MSHEGQLRGARIRRVCTSFSTGFHVEMVQNKVIQKQLGRHLFFSKTVNPKNHFFYSCSHKLNFVLFYSGNFDYTIFISTLILLYFCQPWYVQYFVHHCLVGGMVVVVDTGALEEDNWCTDPFHFVLDCIQQECTTLKAGC